MLSWSKRIRGFVLISMCGPPRTDIAWLHAIKWRNYMKYPLCKMVLFFLWFHEADNDIYGCKKVKLGRISRYAQGTKETTDGATSESAVGFGYATGGRFHLFLPALIHLDRTSSSLICCSVSSSFSVLLILVTIISPFIPLVLILEIEFLGW